jgi:hypothetical protein
VDAGDAQRTLTELLATHGRALCDDPRRVEALLRDLCGEDRKAIFVLVNALRERVVADLLGWPPGVPPALLHTRLAQRLVADLGFAPDVARWAVETWTAVLGDLPAADDASAASAAPSAPSARRRSPGGASAASQSQSQSQGDAGGPLALETLAAPDVEAAYVAFSRMPAPRTTVRVGPPASGADFATIGEAIRASEPGARIVVAAGRYAEALILDRPVEVIAEGTADALPAGVAAAVGRVPTAGAAGDAGRVVVEASGASCIRMETGYAVVRGLFLRGRTGLDDRTRFAVDVPQGQLILEDCDITSDALACVAIHGSGARPVLRRCQIHDGKGSGVFVHHGGAGTLEDCAIVNNALAGVEIGKDGNPTVRRCTVMDGRGPGVYVSLGGCGTFEACVVSGNGGAGVEIGWLGSPVLRRCRVTRNRHSAVRLYAGGGCTFEACDFSGNDGGAWDIAGGWLQHNGARDGADGHTYIRSGSDDEPEPEHLDADADADADGNEQGHGSGDGTAGGTAGGTTDGARGGAAR